MHLPQDPATRRALLIEPQALFAPYFVATLERSGLDVVAVAKRPRTAAVRALAPDIVVIDAGHQPVAPLQTIRALREVLPGAHIVVFAVTDDDVWHALARAVGADIVIGRRAEERELLAALAA